MSNPNIVYLANDSPKPSTSTTKAEPIATITSNSESNQVQRFSSEIQIPLPPVVLAYENQQGSLISGFQNNFTSINPPAVAINPGYYLAPNAIDVSPVNVASYYLASGYCDFGSNAWRNFPSEEVPIRPMQQINEMALDPYSAPNNPIHSLRHPVLDTFESSKKYNQEVEKFLNRIKLNDDVASKTTKVTKKLACECSKYKKYKTSVIHVPMKNTKTSKTIETHPKVSSGKTKIVSQNRTKIDKIKKQIDLIENEIQRRKTELSAKEQQIQNEINIIQQKQPMGTANSTKQLVTCSDNEQDISDGQAFKNEHATIEIKKKPQIKSVVNIAKIVDLNNSNMYKTDYKMRRKAGSKNNNSHPYKYPLKRESKFAKSNVLNSYAFENNNMGNNPQIKTERIEKKIKENIVISLNLEQDLHCSNKQFTIRQHESSGKNEKEIHLTIKITGNDNPTQIKNIKNEENDGSVIDLSFLDEIDVDEIVECLNVSDEPIESIKKDFTAIQCYSLQTLKNEDNTNSLIAPSDIKNGSEHYNENYNYSSLNEDEKAQGLAQNADCKCTEVIKSDQTYDEFMEIYNVINNPGFMNVSQNSPQLAIETSFANSQVPLVSDCLADLYDPVIIKSSTIETATLKNFSEYNNDEITIQENSEANHADYVNQHLKDDLSESATSLTSYSNCTEYSMNNTLELSDSLPEDMESEDIEQRAKNLLISLFNNPELINTQALSLKKPKHHIPSLEQIGDTEKSLDIDEEMALCVADSNVENILNNTNNNETQKIILECNNNCEELSKRNKDIKTMKNIDISRIGGPSNKLVSNKGDILNMNSINNMIETEAVQNLSNVENLTTSEAIKDQKNNPLKIINENEMHSSNNLADRQKTDQNTDIVKDSEELKNIGISSLREYHDDDAKQNNQIKLPDNSVSKIEIPEEQLVHMKRDEANKKKLIDETDDVVIMTPEPNIAIIDLTEGSEKKKTRKKITYNETSESVQKENITKKSEPNGDENILLPQIEPLKSPRDFALALKLEQGISNLFNSEHEVTGIIKRGMYSDIYQARNKNTGQVATAKVIRNRKDMKLIGIQKTEWMKDLQEGIPKDKYHCLYLFRGLIVDGMWCFVLEYYPKNLEQVLIERGKGFSIEIVQKLARQLVSAVLLLRSHNIIHSDIKPHHILLDATNDNLKLGGFDESFQRVHIKSMSCIGTVHYRAPELMLGYFVGHGIDVWTTALVLYEMMTNIKLFPANTNNEVLYQQLCTLGPVPIRMLTNSKYKDFHYQGGHFFRDGMDPAYKRKPRIVYRFFESERIITTVFGAYTKHWACLRAEHKDADHATLSQFCKLLKQMLLMDPYCRIGIESVYAHGFIYE